MTRSLLKPRLIQPVNVRFTWEYIHDPHISLDITKDPLHRMVVDAHLRQEGIDWRITKVDKSKLVKVRSSNVRIYIGKP